MIKPVPTTLYPEETVLALKAIPMKKGQAPRLIRYLSCHPSSPTVFVNTNCAIGNISDIAMKINPALYRQGLMIACEKPTQPILNRFGEPSNMFLWSIYRISEQPELNLSAANDAEY